MENEFGLIPKHVIRLKDRVHDYAGRPVGTYVQDEGSTVECPHCGRPALRQVANRHLGPEHVSVTYLHRQEWEGKPTRGCPGDHLVSYSDWRCEGEVS